MSATQVEMYQTFVQSPILGAHDKHAVVDYFKGDANGDPITHELDRIVTFFGHSDKREVTIRNIRDSKEHLSLDVQGFELHTLPSGVNDLRQEEDITTQYYKESGDFIKKLTGATLVVPFNHAIRSVPFTKVEEQMRNAPTESHERLLVPVRHIHGDQSYHGASLSLTAFLERMTDMPEARKAKIRNSRFQIINIWRPLKLIERDPFAVVDARSIAEEDLVRVPTKHPDGRMAETWQVKPERSEEHKWWYAYKMRPEEVLVFKQFDSKTDGVARRVPHTSFVDEEFEAAEFGKRESLELRLLTVYEDEEEEGE